MNNNTTRRRFNKFYENYFQPNKQLLAKEIGISSAYFSYWLNNKREVSPEVLKKINRLIDKYDKLNESA